MLLLLFMSNFQVWFKKIPQFRVWFDFNIAFEYKNCNKYFIYRTLHRKQQRRQGRPNILTLFYLHDKTHTKQHSERQIFLESFAGKCNSCFVFSVGLSSYCACESFESSSCSKPGVVNRISSVSQFTPKFYKLIVARPIMQGPILICHKDRARESIG